MSKYIFYSLSILVVAVCIFLYSLEPVEKKNTVQANPRAQFEIALVYIGSSTCPICRDDRLPQIINNLSNKLYTFSDSLGYTFKMIGVSKDSDLQQGLHHLEEIGDFDEISTGGDYLNTTIQRYVWEQTPGILNAGTPQVVLVKREYELDPHTKKPLFTLKNEKIVERRVGLSSIYFFSRAIQTQKNILSQ